MISMVSGLESLVLAVQIWKKKQQKNTQLRFSHILGTKKHLIVSLES